MPCCSAASRLANPQLVKSGAAAIPISALTRSERRSAACSAIQPPIDDPTSTNGPSVSWSITARLCSSQRPSVPSAKLPLLDPVPE